MMYNRSYSWVLPLALGAVAIYFLDPDRGGHRRALVRDKAVSATRKTRDGIHAFIRDLKNRLTGLRAESRALMSNDYADDRMIEDRVRSALGRVCSHPSAISVFSSDRHLTLAGVVLSAEHGTVLRAVSRVRGVVGLNDRLQAYADAATIPSLQPGISL